MREKRYECEFKIKEEQKFIDILRKEIEGDMKKMKVIDTGLKSNQEDLQAYMVRYILFRWIKLIEDT